MDTSQWTAIDWMVLGSRKIDQHEFTVVGTEEELTGPIKLTVRVHKKNCRHADSTFCATIDSSTKSIVLDQSDIALLEIWRMKMLRYFD
jgi:hypothetical protein